MVRYHTGENDGYLCIGEDVSELKIYEIINKYFGEAYTGWMKAWYGINDKYAAWFPKISKTNEQPTGSYGGTKNYSNTLSEDETVITEVKHDEIDDTKPSQEIEQKDELRLVFGRINGKFKFLGVFNTKRIPGQEHPTYRHERIAVGINLSTFELITELNGEFPSVTEWIISGNPKIFNIEDAFRDLKRLDWKQSTNVNVGDIVYIYISENYQRIRYKCKVNKVDLKELEIDDSKYNISGETDGSYGRYMELEPIAEFDTKLFNRDELMKHGFITPQSPRKVGTKLKEYLDVVQYLQNVSEMNPDSHDGSYELARETVLAYKKKGDLSDVDYLDLNLLYHMVIGTWKLKVELKKKSVDKSHLSNEEKEHLKSVLDNVWKNANDGLYENIVGDVSIGMFGTGFYSFNSKDDGEAAREFIGLCVDILDLNDDSEIYEVAEQHLNKELLGLKAASASAMLHCIKPFTFPILNTNSGSENIYEYFGVKLEKKSNLTTFVNNCKSIKAFRDSYFKAKNYRIYDRAAWRINNDSSDEIKDNLLLDDGFWPSYDEYPVDITKEDWKRFIEEVEFPTHKGCMRVLKCYLDIGGTAAPKKMSDIYKGHSMVYTSSVSNTSRRALKYFNMEPCVDQKDNSQWQFPIAFQGKAGEGNDKGTYVYKMRPELMAALKEIDLSEIELEYKKKAPDMNESKYNKNLILYGPPGTGKTYNSILYAVAICEGASIEELQAEEYSDVIERFNELRNEGRIAFTTFHQSYGYEEFIEGIKPTVDDSEDTDGEIRYSIEDGMFKKFCERASLPVSSSKVADDYGLNKNPVVWKVSLEGTGDNPTRTDCLENNHIRIGWDRYGEVITDDTEFTNGGRIVLNSFINKMQVGDIVLSCYSASTIDAIGVVTGDYEWHPEYSAHKRLRNVRWLAKNIDYNILEVNGNTSMTLSTVYKLKLTVADVFKILDEVGTSEVTSSKNNDKPYVFIIDEINRGNISKIFGELITLIEPSKRIGKSEELRVELPYSKKQFGVPDNVYILGTMNTADRSIALMDTALRRRFHFVEMMPDSEVIKDLIIEQDGETIDVAEMLKIINLRIEYLYDREHTIGHAYFMPLFSNPSIDKLAEIFDTNIIPLLKEYFYEDYGKIQMILGDNKKSSDDLKFIKETKLITKDIFNGDTSELDLPEQIYSIQKEALYNIRSYKEISKEL